MEQLIAHLVGDYILQSDYMANNKKQGTHPYAVWICFGHAAWYTVPFGLLTQSIPALLVILFSHLFIDHFSVARWIIFARNNVLAPTRVAVAWEDTTGTGFHRDRPVWLATWLFIIADNTLHLICNYAALRWL